MDNKFLIEKIRDEAIIQLKPVIGKTAADIGADRGFMSEGLINAGLKVIALDSSPAAIDFLRQKFRDIDEFKAVLTENETMNPGNESVDYVFAYLFLHRIKNPKEQVKEIFRILKHGGKAAVIDILQNDINVPVMSSKDMLHGFSFPDLYEWFINAGFRNISIEKTDHSVFQTDSPDGEFIFDTFIACGEK